MAAPRAGIPPVMGMLFRSRERCYHTLTERRMRHQRKQNPPNHFRINAGPPFAAIFHHTGRTTYKRGVGRTLERSVATERIAREL